jgi:ABC-type multidrug transport system fused ATPase/permease subunit
LKSFQKREKKILQSLAETIFYQWFQIIKPHVGRYLLAMLAGVVSVATATALLLMVTYAISMLQGSLRPVTWSELVGEHASRWISPLVRNTIYENGLSVELQKLIVVPALIGIALLGNGLKIILEYSIEDLGERITKELRQKISLHFLQSGYCESKEVSPALIGNFLGEDTREIRQCFTRLCGSVPIEAIATFVYISLLGFLDTQLFVLFFAIFLPAGIVIRATGKYLRRLARLGLNVQTELTQSYLEKMRGWQTIQSFSAQNFEVIRFEQKNNDIFNIWRRSARAKSLSSPSVEWLGIAAGACVLILALRRVSEGALPSSILTAFLITVAQLSNSFQTVVNQLNTTKRGNAALRRINDFLSSHENMKDKKDNNNPLKEEIVPEYNDISEVTILTNSLGMNHPSLPDRMLFRDVSLEIGNGDTLAITGPSGVGKSTLMECLSGLRAADSGEISVILNNRKEISSPVLSEHVKVTYLSQEPFIFDGSIFENILYPSKPNHDSAEQISKARECLQKACLGYKDLSENALSLSGGEKQRIAFARGFMLQPHVWMIDEGTSALDLETESELMKNLKHQFPDSIKLFIAHRPALLRFANKQLTLSH